MNRYVILLAVATVVTPVSAKDVKGEGDQFVSGFSKEMEPSEPKWELIDNGRTDGVRFVSGLLSKNDAKRCPSSQIRGVVGNRFFSRKSGYLFAFEVRGSSRGLKIFVNPNAIDNLPNVAYGHLMGGTLKPGKTVTVTYVSCGNAASVEWVQAIQ